MLPRHIDRQLQQCGWIVQSFRDMNISAGLGVAVREFPLKSGLADYLLYADCKALGVIEAKPEGHSQETKGGTTMTTVTIEEAQAKLPAAKRRRLPSSEIERG